MGRLLTLRSIILAALLLTLVRAVVVHSGHLGPGEWIVAGVLIVALLAAVLRIPRRAV